MQDGKAQCLSLYLSKSITYSTYKPSGPAVRRCLPQGSGMAARQALKPNAGCPYMQPACGMWIGLPAGADVDMDPVAVAVCVRVGRSV